MAERLVPDGLWELFQRVVPAAPVRPQGGGRRRYGDRQVLAAIVFVAATGCTWRQLPPGFGPSGPTAHRRFTEWSRARVWGKLHRLVLDELGARGALDWSRCAIDSVDMRAAKGGPRGSESRRSWQEGIKNQLITARTGLPLSIGISAANTHDSQGLEPLVRGIPPIRSRCGPRRRRPATLHGTRATTTTICAVGSGSRNITPRIARRGIDSSQRLGRNRWTVERTVAWLAGCRRLHRRYERKAEHFLAFAGIAAALICYRRLAG
ncbi:IS5 family transposase [Streptomyces sp. NPDC048224]|uniref:IS5 family transposase n=1 Tax=Streptomyces sp. NPDC048224 TaxID=3154500 RepID=UPI0033CCED9C